MTVRNLDVTFNPRSVAILGAGADPIVRAIQSGGFKGTVWPIDPRRTSAEGIACFASVAELPGTPDIAVLALPPDQLPDALGALGARGCRLAIVTTRMTGAPDALRQAMLNAARPHLLRILGPNAIGVVLPYVGLNASLAPEAATPGRVSIISQSGTVTTTLIDWASEHGIGFSQVLSLGDMVDVDVADCLDLAAMDGHCRAILLYLETIPNPRKFLSAARAAARIKPVIALKAGRTPQAAEAALTHTGSLSGTDAVVDAALRRAGILRVNGLAEMFAAAETVGRFRPADRARLAIVANGGGPGVLAVDRLLAQGGRLADLSPETGEALARILPQGRRATNPIDLGPGADAEAYAAALDILANDANTDALLVMHGPTRLADPVAIADAVAGQVRDGLVARKPVFACWMGGVAASTARRSLRTRGIACYDTPAGAAAAVRHLTDWGRAQAALLHVPDRLAENDARQSGAARARAAAIFSAVAHAGRRVLTEPEATAVLAAYGIPAPELRLAPTPEAVAVEARALLAGAERIVVKIVSSAILHKSDLGGVVLDIRTPAEAELAARAIAARAADAGTVLDGFALQPMIRRPEAQELILGIGRDPIFGPVILFGTGGVAVEIIKDTAIELPPLDQALAAGLVARTRAGQLLAGFRGRAPADAPALYRALIALSNLAEDFPCIRTVDVNPLIADAGGVLMLDAQMVIEPADINRAAPNPDLAIRPYPAAWRRSFTRGDRTFEIRPIRPEDAKLYPDLFARTDPEDLRLRFLTPRRSITEDMALRLTQLDYGREMAFVALTETGELAGVARFSADPDHVSGEYATLVRSDLKGNGLGGALMRMLIDYAAADGLRRLDGIVLAENRSMLGFIRSLGFTARPDPEDPAILLTTLDLADAARLADERTAP